MTGDTSAGNPVGWSGPCVFIHFISEADGPGGGAGAAAALPTQAATIAAINQ